MTPRFTVFDIAKHYGLDIEYLDVLPESVGGYLDSHPEPRYMAINAKLPQCEQVFTVAHEIGHYVIHHSKPRRKHYGWLVDHQWKFGPMAQFSRYFKLGRVLVLNREWEADSYALVLLIQLGHVDHLTAYLDRHPEKMKWAVLAVFISFCNAFPRLLALPFRIVFNLLAVRHLHQ